MPHYQIRGEVPKKRHIVFEKPNGDLYSEEVVSAEGFSDIYSIVYHNHAPTKVLKIDKPLDVIPEIAVSNNLQNRSFNGFSIQPEDDYLKSRRIVLTNDDVNLILAAPKKSMIEYFFKNAQSDEMIFIHQGSGILKTVYGELEYKEGDHLIIPRGTNYQFAFENTINRMFIVESKQPLRFPRRYMNK